MPHKIYVDTPNYNTLYLKKLDNLLKTVNNRVAYVEFRNNILKQKAKDYQMESDKINGILQSSALYNTHPNYQRLKHRAEELKKLGAKAFNRGIEDFLKNN